METSGTAISQALGIAKSASRAWPSLRRPAAFDKMGSFKTFTAYDLNCPVCGLCDRSINVGLREQRQN